MTVGCRSLKVVCYNGLQVWGLQLELAHFASIAIMNLTVESSGDPHLLSWAMPCVVRQPKNEIEAIKSLVRDICILLMALAS